MLAEKPAVVPVAHVANAKPARATAISRARLRRIGTAIRRHAALVTGAIGLVTTIAWLRACALEAAREDACLCKGDVVKAMAKQLAYEAYPRWRADHLSALCPSSVDELLPYSNMQEAKDPWGNDFVMLCGPGTFRVIPGGPDQALLTGTP